MLKVKHLKLFFPDIIEKYDENDEITIIINPESSFKETINKVNKELVFNFRNDQLNS